MSKLDKLSKLYVDNVLSQDKKLVPINTKATLISTKGKVFLGLSVLSGIFSIASFMQKSQAEKQIAYRKSQLKKPLFEMTIDQMVNPPWNKQNLREWLYRRVKVTGRTIHRHTCFIPNKQFGLYGYEYLVPLVVSENQNFKQQKGLILSKGWIPGHLKPIDCRNKLEVVDVQQFIGFVSLAPELQRQSFFKGNAPQQGRLSYNEVNLEDLTKSSGFINQKQCSVAIIEELHEEGYINERNPHRRDIGVQLIEEYPYAKTESGALQLPKMPWELKTEGLYYAAGSAISLLLATGFA